MSFKNRGGGVEVTPRSVISQKWTLFLCIASFCAGMFFTARMKMVMDSIIGRAQSAFVEGRNIGDNVLLSHELFNGYNRKWISPRCIVKVDLRKAYDTVDWRCLKAVMEALGFPCKFIEWVMECVTTVSYSLMINGGLTKPFQAKRGLRQGDPMSPYLFVVVMEYLNRELKQMVKDRMFQFHPKCKKLEVVHMCFADDLLLFSKGRLDAVQRLKQRFRVFSEATGLEANAEKSAVYIAGVAQDTKEDILAELGYKEGTLPFRYLGVPLATKKLNVQQYMPLIERITAKVKCWSARLLSYAGREQLIKSVLFGMQSYWAQIFILPKKVIKLVETICRTFLWTGQGEISKKALVAWEKVCRPRVAGGLNIIDLELWNKCAILKHLWALTEKKDILWIRWVHIFYIKNKPIEVVPIPKAATWLIRKIIESRKYINQMRMQRSINMWLQQLVRSGKFSIRLAYKELQLEYPRVSWRKLVLHKYIHPRTRFILWLAVQNRLMTVDRLVMMNIQVPVECVFCQSDEETMDHLFFKCSYSTQIWSRILRWIGFNRVVGGWSQEVEWMGWLARSRSSRAEITVCAFAKVIYSIWNDRNKARFQQYEPDGSATCKEIAMHVHFKGRQQLRWKTELERLNSYP